MEEQRKRKEDEKRRKQEEELKEEQRLEKERREIEARYARERGEIPAPEASNVSPQKKSSARPQDCSRSACRDATYATMVRLVYTVESIGAGAAAR